jgi:hypothetical protein
MNNQLSNSSETSQQSDPTLRELITIRQELERLHDRYLAKAKELNEQNAALVKEVSLLRKNLIDHVAKGVVIGSIFLGLMIGLMQMCVAQN